jgi:23S rRNA (cytosine1962-C5)-methyltransferase
MPQIWLKPGKSKPILQRHSWIFQGSVERFSHPNSVGLAEVLNENNQVLGYGFTDPGSQMVCRIFHFGTLENPKFDLAYWKKRFSKCLEIRRNFLPPQTDTYRLIHAEGDDIPGLIVDIYGGNTAVVQTNLPATTQWIGTWKTILSELGFQYFFHKANFQKEGKWISETPKLPLRSLEYGFAFEVDVEKGQKTGFFIDQRENRKFIGQYAKEKKVLNAFSFSGGFSVFAIAGGAREVHSVDISKEACAMAERNVQINFPEFKNHKCITKDCFEYLRKMDDDFDLIVLDPPAFAKSKSALEAATRGYKEINLHAFKKIKPGGFLATFSCSQHMDKELFRKVVFGAASDAGRSARILHFFVQPPDHPINLFHPESEYLKGLFIQVD